ncbi:MAG: ERF family protein [Clostridia bacterium]|nr:ERF family protein [Clostridia bacterium]
MENSPRIYQDICAAMNDIEAIGKQKRNQQQGFLYRGIDDVMNMLHPILAKHGLFIAPEVLEHSREVRTTKSNTSMTVSIMKIRYTMYARDGSSINTVVIGEGMDNADKSSNKSMAVAMKYALFQLFCIPTEDMRDNDPDRTTPEDTIPNGTEYSGNHIAETSPQSVPACADCGKSIDGVVLPNGTEYSGDHIAETSRQKYGRCLCWNCSLKEKASVA